MFRDASILERRVEETHLDRARDGLDRCGSGRSWMSSRWALSGEGRKISERATIARRARERENGCRTGKDKSASGVSTDREESEAALYQKSTQRRVIEEFRQLSPLRPAGSTEPPTDFRVPFDAHRFPACTDDTRTKHCAGVKRKISLLLEDRADHREFRTHTLAKSETAATSDGYCECTESAPRSSTSNKTTSRRWTRTTVRSEARAWISEEVAKGVRDVPREERTRRTSAHSSYRSSFPTRQPAKSTNPNSFARSS